MGESNINFPSALTRTIIEDKDLVLYRPKLNQITESVLATILLQQIIYWANKTSNLFYKFKEPCEHKFYKPGDSWTEELGFSRREYDTAIAKIAKKYNPNKENPPDDCFIVYYTDFRRLTWYSVNWTMLNSAIEEVFLPKVQNALYVKADSAFSYSANPPLQYIVTETTTKTTNQTSTSPPDLNQKIKIQSHINKKDDDDDDDDVFSLLNSYGIPENKTKEFIQKFSSDFIKKKIKEIEYKFVKGSINNLQGYIITTFEKTSIEESEFEKNLKIKKEQSQKQKEQEKLLIKKKEQIEERQHQEYMNITTKLMDECNVVELRWFSEWVKSISQIVFKLYKEKGLKSYIVETYYRKYLYEKYYSTI